MPIAINDNAIHTIAGFVFNMTDCLSEDDDKEPHRGYLFKCITPLQIWGAGVIVCNSCEKLTGLDGFSPVREFLATGNDVNPVFFKRTSCGLIGL